MSINTWWIGSGLSLYDVAGNWTSGIPVNGSGDYAIITASDPTIGPIQNTSYLDGYTILLTNNNAGTGGIYVGDNTTFGAGMAVITAPIIPGVPATATIFVESGQLTNDGTIGLNSTASQPDNSLLLYSHGGPVTNDGAIYSYGPGSSLLIQTENQYPGFSGTFTNDGLLLDEASAAMTINGAVNGPGLAYVSGDSNLTIEGPVTNPAATFEINGSTLELTPHLNFMPPEYPAQAFYGLIDPIGDMTLQIDGETGQWFNLDSNFPGESVLTVFSPQNQQIGWFRLAGNDYGPGAIGMTNVNGNIDIAVHTS